MGYTLRDLLDSEDTYDKISDWFVYDMEQYIERILKGDISCLATLVQCAFNAGEEKKNLKEYNQTQDGEEGEEGEDEDYYNDSWDYDDYDESSWDEDDRNSGDEEGVND